MRIFAAPEFPASQESIPIAKLQQVPRNLFSFPVLLAALLVMLGVLTVRSRFDDPDLWWHLKTGEIIWNTHSIPSTDQFSFTASNHPYTPHEWLSQLTIYAGWKFGGYRGLMAWLCLFTSLLLVAAFVLCSLYSGNSKVGFCGALLIWLFSTVGLAIRPHMTGYLLLTAELLLIYLGRSHYSRWFLGLPIVFVVWVNSHGSFFLGWILLALFLASAFLNLRAGLLVCRPWEVRGRRVLAISFLLSTCALFLNPAGLRQIAYPLDVFFLQHELMRSVAEWQPSGPQDLRLWVLVATAALIFLLPIGRRVDLPLMELAASALGAFLAIRHHRMLFVFGILAAPVLCRLLADLWPKYQPDRDHPTLNAILLALSIIIVVVAFPSTRFLEAQVEGGSPVKAVEFIRRSGLSGRMLNEYVFGGYLIWAAPEHKVFVDGRGDLFEWTGVLADYGAWATLKADPRLLLHKYGIDFCLLSRKSPMCRVLPLLPEWKQIYSDELSAIFVRT